MIALRHSFVVTVSAAMWGACTPEQTLPPNPPPAEVSPKPQVDVEPTATAAPEPAPTRQDGPINPKDAEGRTIQRAFNGDGCFVDLPFAPLKPGEQRMPGTAPPTTPVPCPPLLKDPAFETCRGGVISTKAGGCECFVPANPPLVSPNACPDGY